MSSIDDFQDSMSIMAIIPMISVSSLALSCNWLDSFCNWLALSCNWLDAFCNWLALSCNWLDSQHTRYNGALTGEDNPTPCSCSVFALSCNWLGSFKNWLRPTYNLL